MKERLGIEAVRTCFKNDEEIHGLLIKRCKT